jgi:HEAT repeats
MPHPSRSLALIALVLVPLPLPSSEPSQPKPREQAWAVLNSGLEHTKAPHREEAVKALSLVTGERTAVKLALRALVDDNPEVRAAAATTLGQLHAASAIPELRQALSDKGRQKDQRRVGPGATRPAERSEESGSTWL